MNIKKSTKLENRYGWKVKLYNEIAKMKIHENLFVTFYQLNLGVILCVARCIT